MEGVSKKRKREDDPPRITVLAPHKTFERLFKENSLSSLRSCIGKKLGFDEKTTFELVQSRNGRTIDLEDDDDFDAFRSFAYSNGSAEVRVRVNAQARSVAFTSEPEIIPSSSDFPSTEGKKRKKSGLKSTDDFPADPSTYSTSGAATSSAANESKNSKPKSKKKKKTNANVPAADEAGSSKPSEPVVAAEGDKLTTKKKKASSTASSIPCETDAVPKSKESKSTDDGPASDPSKAKTKTKLKQNGADASDKVIATDSSENASNGPTPQPEPSEPLPKKKKKKLCDDAGPADSTVTSITDPIGPLTTQASSTPPEATAAVPPSKKVSKKTKSAENNVLSSTEKELSVESAGGDVEKEASAKHPPKRTKRVPRGSKSHVVHEQTPSSVDNLSLGPYSEVQEPASSSMVQSQNPVNNQEPAKKRKKLNEKAPQDLSIVPTSTAEESVGGTKKRKAPTSAPLVSQVPEEDAPSFGPARKKKRVSSAAVDALDDIINNILKNPLLPSTSTSQLQSVPRASTSVSATPAKNQQLTSDAQGVAEGKEKDVITKAKAKAGKNRKKVITDTDKSVASSSSAKDVVSEVIPHKAAKLVKNGKRGALDKEATDQQVPASVAVATEVKAQSTAEQPQASDLAANRQQSTCGNNSSPRPSKKQTKGNGQASALATGHEQRSTSLGLLPFAPSGSSLSEVLVEGKDEGSSSESGDESHGSDSSDSDVIPPPPPLMAGRFQPSPKITIPALTEMSLLESLLKPSTPRSWREILSSPEEDSEEEKVSSVPDEEDEEGDKREKKKRRSSAFTRRSSSTPSVDDDDDDDDDDGAVAFGVARETPEKAYDKVASIEEERIDEVAVVEPLRDRNPDQDFLAQSNTDSGYGSANLKQPDGIEAGPLFCGSQRSTTESELNLSFKAINDRGESVISEGRQSQDAASIKSDDPQVFTRSAQETASRTAQHHSSSPDPIGLMIDDDPIENVDSGNDSSRSQRQSVEEHEHQLPVYDAAATSVVQGHQSSEDLTFLYPDAQEPVWHGEPTDHDNTGAKEKESQTHVNGLPNVTRRSFTPPPIAILAPITPGTIKRMRDRYGKLPNPPDISKCTILVPASSQVDSGNTADSAFGDTTEGEDRIDQLLSSSVPRSHAPAKATTINTVKRPRKVAEQWPEGKGEDLPIGTRLRKRGLSKQAEIAIPVMPPPAKVRKSARARKEHQVSEPPAPVATIAETEETRDMQDTSTPKLIVSTPYAAVVGGLTSNPPPSSEGVNTSLSEVEDVLDATSGKTSASSFDMPPPTNTKGSQRDRSPASDSDEEKLAVMTERNPASRPIFSHSFRSLQNIVNQKDLFSPATSQPSFLLTPVISFENKVMPNSKGEEDDEDDSSSDSDSDDVNQSVIPKEKRAGNKSSKPRGALASFK